MLSTKIEEPIPYIWSNIENDQFIQSNIYFCDFFSQIIIGYLKIKDKSLEFITINVVECKPTKKCCFGRNEAFGPTQIQTK